MLLCLIVTTTQLIAEARAPQLVISGFIKALQKNDVKYLKKYADLDKIKKQPKRSYTIKELKSLFSKTDVTKIVISKPTHNKKTGIIKVRLSKPLSIEFELQHQNTKSKLKLKKSKGDFYRIIGIHP